ncbi:HAD-IIIA family hydrolase [Paenibacillus hexagrammi]|uniref:D,D-heptose 1,7-bisphosphate phosphatase n=1 Tax=Paenibacillus hexagrammi TaxID=2908839 RepID=A0ABY3SQR7_9BACL|nr:HAD-IIIA family hydrolase [Paenibacillus sp. YPD9-1]
MDKGYVTSWKEFKWLPGAIEGIRALNERGWLVFIITNQACVGKNILEREVLDDIHERMQRDLQRNQASISQIYVCPHRPEAHCACRKPRPGMLLQAAREHRLRLHDCYVVGDSLTDMITAKEVKSYSILVRSGLGQRDEQQVRSLELADHYCETVDEAVHHIIQKEEAVV